MIPSEVTVLIDSRERRPLLFPSWITFHGDRTLDAHQIQVKTEVVTMPAGDYALKGYEDVCLIETKRSLRELHNNVCTNEWPRVGKALKRLSEACDYPYIVWEITPSQLFWKSKHVPDPELVLDRWHQVIVHFNLRLMLAGIGSNPGPRRKLGEQLVRLMIVHVLNDRGFDL